MVGEAFDRVAAARHLRKLSRPSTVYAFDSDEVLCQTGEQQLLRISDVACMAKPSCSTPRRSSGDDCLAGQPLGKSLPYALSHWVVLGRYAEDGWLSIDNNLAEELLRFN